MFIDFQTTGTGAWEHLESMIQTHVFYCFVAE